MHSTSTINAIPRASVIEILRSHLELQLEILNRLQSALDAVLPTATSGPANGNLQAHIEQIRELQGPLQESQLRLSAQLTTVEDFGNSTPADGVDRWMSSCDDDRIQETVRQLRYRTRRWNRSLRRLRLLVEDTNRVYQSFLQALVGHEQACRYGADGRLYHVPLRLALPDHGFAKAG